MCQAGKYLRVGVRRFLPYIGNHAEKYKPLLLFHFANDFRRFGDAGITANLDEWRPSRTAPYQLPYLPSLP